MPPKDGGGGGGETTARNGPGNANNAAAPDRNKVVIRGCPPELPPKIFWASVERWAGKDDVDWRTVSAQSHRKGQALRCKQIATKSVQTRAIEKGRVRGAYSMLEQGALMTVVAETVRTAK